MSNNSIVFKLRQLLSARNFDEFKGQIVQLEFELNHKQIFSIINDTTIQFSGIPNRGDESVFQYCISSNLFEIFNFLMDSKYGDINSFTMKKGKPVDSCLILAAKCKNIPNFFDNFTVSPKIFDMILENPAHINVIREKDLSKIMIKDNFQVIESLCRHFPQQQILWNLLHFSSQYRLSFSILIKHLGIEEIKKRDGYEGSELLRSIILKNSIMDHDIELKEQVKSFLDEGIPVEVDYSLSTPLSACKKNSTLLTAQLLLERGADVNRIGETGHVYHNIRSKELSRLFAKSGFKLFNSTCGGTTPLYEVAKIGDVETFKYFIEQGADVDYLDWRSHSILHKVADCIEDRRNISVMLEFVLKISTKHINTPDIDGFTPLLYHLNSQKQIGSADIHSIECLLEFGADVTLKTNQKESCLELACYPACKRFQTMKMLLEHGTDATELCSTMQPLIHLLLENTPTVVLILLLWKYGGCSHKLITQEYNGRSAFGKGRFKNPEIQKLLRFIEKWPKLSLIYLSMRKPTRENMLSHIPRDILLIIAEMVRFDEITK